MIKKALVTAVAIAVTSGVANAGENKFTKEEGTGMLTGAAAGAVVGGPIGAAIGFMFGGILGDSIGTANRADLHAKQLEQDLADTRTALAQASERTGGDEMLDALAQRLHADVLFRTNGSELSLDVASRLEDLGKLLAAHPQLDVQLHGFADPRGNSEKNLELSLARASAVRDALMKGGAAPEQIQLSAHGEDLSTAPKGDLEAYAWERRVSLSIRPSTTAAVAQSN
jgi:outer membrane protein OmpA-like peptidoglycan-associated protein